MIALSIVFAVIAALGVAFAVACVRVRLQLKKYGGAYGEIKTPELTKDLHGHLITSEKIFSGMDTYTPAEKIEGMKSFALHEFLTSRYPFIFTKLEVTDCEGSYLVHYKGKTSGRKPIVMIADPRIKGRAQGKSGWKNGKIYGSGMSGDKGACIALLESVEALLKEGYVPQTDIYIVINTAGMHKVSSVLKSAIQGIGLLVFSRGTVVTGIKADRRFPIITVGEVSCIEMRLTAHPGGETSAAEKLAKLILSAKKLGLRFYAESRENKRILYQLLPFMPFFAQLIFCNPKLFAGFKKRLIAKNVRLRHLYMPVTEFSGYERNTIEDEGGESVRAKILATPYHDRNSYQRELVALCEKFGISCQEISKSRPVRLSEIDGYGYRYVEAICKDVFGKGAKTLPYIARTCGDITSLVSICDEYLGFSPMEGSLRRDLNEEEFLSEESAARAAAFYTELIKGWN